MTWTLVSNQLIYLSYWSLTVRSLRPRASSSSSQSERSTSPLVMSSTHSLETMPRFALSTDDEGNLGPTFWFFCFSPSIFTRFTFWNMCFLQLRWLSQTFGGSGFEATALGPSTPLPRTQLAHDVSVTSWRHQTNRGFHAEGRFPSLPRSQPCLSSSLQVHVAIITVMNAVLRQGGKRLFCPRTQEETVMFQTTLPGASSPAPSPLTPCPPTLRPVTPPPAATCHSAPAAWSHLLSFTPQGRSTASPFRPLGSTWVTAMSTRCIIWFR